MFQLPPIGRISQRHVQKQRCRVTRTSVPGLPVPGFKVRRSPLQAWAQLSLPVLPSGVPPCANKETWLTLYCLANICLHIRPQMMSWVSLPRHPGQRERWMRGGGMRHLLEVAALVVIDCYHIAAVHPRDVMQPQGELCHHPEDSASTPHSPQQLVVVCGISSHLRM